ncbi:down syndrome cell adhesion molecule-like protein 1 [Trichonephila clavipes]|nr:down syndrome cell adhesion molecule-like protein 1 [Trichonephila clavipes]
MPSRSVDMLSSQLYSKYLYISVLSSFQGNELSYGHIEKKNVILQEELCSGKEATEWYRLRDGPSHGIKRVDTSHQRIMELNGTLLIRKAIIQDGGKYICIVNNTNGQERAETELLIRDRLQVRAVPPAQTVDVGKTAIFTCNASGHPVHIISWRKDMVPVLSSRRISVSREELRISPVEREDKGMYQCFVYNDKESAQDAAQLLLGGKHL